LDGFFGDTGASFAVPPTSPRIERLCEDGRRAMWAGIRAVKPGARLNEIGRSIETFAQKNGYSLIRNLASHGIGRSLHDEPSEIPTWYEKRDRPPHHGRPRLHDRAVPVARRGLRRRNGRWLDAAPAAAPGRGAVRAYAGHASRPVDPDARLSPLYFTVAI
jgi:hypothetical protein